MIWRVVLTRSRVLRDSLIISHPFLFVKGFSKSFFQNFSRFFLNRSLISAEVPDYYITTLFVCQEVFEKFFKNFSRDFPGLFGSCSLRKATCVLYHISFRLSRGFSKVFSTFFVIFFRGCVSVRCIHTLVDLLHSCAPLLDRCLRQPLSLTACIL